MEFANGGDLRNYLDKEGAQKEIVVRHFFKQIGNFSLF